MLSSALVCGTCVLACFVGMAVFSPLVRFLSKGVAAELSAAPSRNAMRITWF